MPWNVQAETIRTRPRAEYRIRGAGRRRVERYIGFTRPSGIIFKLMETYILSA
jgi:hypothetical protein